MSGIMIVIINMCLFCINEAGKRLNGKKGKLKLSSDLTKPMYENSCFGNNLHLQFLILSLAENGLPFTKHCLVMRTIADYDRELWDGFLSAIQT